LNYNKEETEKFAQEKGIDLPDVMAYDMTPYSNDPSPESDEPAPDGVNDDDDLTLDEIEGEEPENLEGSDTMNEEPEKGDDGDSSDDDGKGDDGDSSDGKGDDGEPDDKKGGDDVDTDTKTDKQAEGESGKGETDESGEEGEGEGEGSEGGDEDGESAGDGGGKPSDDDVAIPSGVAGDTVVDQLNQAFNVEDIVGNFRKQRRLLNSLDAWSLEELKETFFEPLQVSDNTTKEEFIKAVKEKTNPYFEE
jgi:hypothetical protein